MSIAFQDNDVLGKFNDDCAAIGKVIDQAAGRSEELKAAYERIGELKTSLAEMVLIYWGDGDGIEPAPLCIQRAQTALAEEVSK